MVEAELRSGITSAFNKRLNEALQFDPQMPFNIENKVSPSQTLAVLKGEQGTPGLPAAISAVKDDNNLVALATSTIERGTLTLYSASQTPGGTGTLYNDFTVPAGKKWIVKICRNVNTGTMTQTCDYLLGDNLTNATGFATATSGTFNYVFPNVITLPAGWVLRGRFIITAYTSGDIQSKIIVQELTV